MLNEQLIQQLEQILADLKAGSATALPRLVEMLGALGAEPVSVTRRNGGSIAGVDVGSRIQAVIRQNGLSEQAISRLIDIRRALKALSKRLLLNYAGPRRRIRVFVSSPGDVAEERDIVLSVVNRLNLNPLIGSKIEIEPVAWERPSSHLPLADRAMPHESIDRKVLPSDCELVVVILWARMGPPLDAEWVKPEPFRYLHGTEWEARYLSGTEYQWVDAMQAAAQCGRPVVLTYRRSEEVRLDPGSPDFDACLEQYERVRAFFDSFTEPDGSIRCRYHLYEKPADFEQLFEEHLLQKINGLLAGPAFPECALETSGRPWPSSRSPFPGLRPFEPEEASVFFGRSAEIDALIRRLSHDRFVTVVAPPGSGKSSLVCAGLLPRLAGGALADIPSWWVISITPAMAGSNPFQALAVGLQAGKEFQNPEALPDYLRAEPATALATICRQGLAIDPEGAEVLLLVDQFEELFTIVDAALREPFACALASLVKSGQARVVIALDAGFYDRCLDLPSLRVLLEAGTYPLYPPDDAQLYQMITGPAEIAGLPFDEKLVWRILEDTGGVPGGLASMACALDHLWRLCVVSPQPSLPQGPQLENEPVLSRAAYDSFGGVQGVIDALTQEACLALPLDETARLAAYRRIFVHLVCVSSWNGGEDCAAARLRAPLERVRGGDGTPEAWLVDALIGARLLMVDHDPATGQATLEVAHEALFQNWEPLRSWIREVGETLRLIDAAQQARHVWEANDCHADFVWPYTRVQEMWDALDRHPDLASYLEPADRDFLRPEQERLIEELHTSIDHSRRAEIGLRLHIVDDTRPGVGLVRMQLSQIGTSHDIRLWGDKPEHVGLPDIVWQLVKGTKGYRLETDDGEKGTYDVADFYIARYPVTYQQYRAFLEAEDGFQSPRWWDGLAVDEDGRSRPGEQRFKYDNHPAENISWFDAIAFCRWLNARLEWPPIPDSLMPKRGLLPGGTLLQDYHGVRLPAEWEWQWAATGGSAAHEYPWGPGWDGTRTNTSENGLNRTTAVGSYPAGTSPCGAMDMSGGVWEWCLNAYGKPQNIGLGGRDSRVVRGGSWGGHQYHARCTCRLGLNPLDRSNSDGGFRLCVGRPQTR
jgi:hypothetical protein